MRKKELTENLYPVCRLCLLNNLCPNKTPDTQSCNGFTPGSEPEDKALTRADVCDIVKDTICRDRTDTHGEPEQSFNDIATMWSLYLNTHVSPEDVAVMMILLKICRYMDGKPVLDHLVDIAGYAAIAAELLSQQGAFDEQPV